MYLTVGFCFADNFPGTTCFSRHHTSLRMNLILSLMSHPHNLLHLHNHPSSNINPPTHAATAYPTTTHAATAYPTQPMQQQSAQPMQSNLCYDGRYLHDTELLRIKKESSSRKNFAAERCLLWMKGPSAMSRGKWGKTSWILTR